jgi:hypothetical protein
VLLLCWLLCASRPKEHFIAWFAGAGHFVLWDSLDCRLMIPPIPNALNRILFCILHEDCCSECQWDLCRTSTNTPHMDINSPNNHPSPWMQDAKRPSFW